MFCFQSPASRMMNNRVDISLSAQGINDIIDANKGIGVMPLSNQFENVSHAEKELSERIDSIRNRLVNLRNLEKRKDYDFFSEKQIKARIKCLHVIKEHIKLVLIDVKMMGVERNLYHLETGTNKTGGVPILGSFPGALKAVVGAVQTTASLATILFSAIPALCKNAKAQRIFHHGYRHLGHGAVNAISGSLIAFPGIGTLVITLGALRNQSEGMGDEYVCLPYDLDPPTTFDPHCFD